MDDANELVSYFNGQILPQGQVMADLSSGGYKAAAGFYDAERTFGGEVFKLRNHRWRRSLGSAARMASVSALRQFS